MIILGNRHTIADNELKNLKKFFGYIKYIDVKHSEKNSKKIIQEIENEIEKKSITTVVINSGSHISNSLLGYLVKLETRTVKYLTMETLFEQYMHKCYIPEDQKNISFLEKIRPYSRSQYIQKRTVDYISVLILGAFSIILAPYTIYRIKKESKGSILFMQTRIGINGKQFTCYKFRSMHEDSPHYPYTRENDSRVFPWGLRMRRMYIDELPQIWNVLKGDMHLIGPRAEWDILVEKYQKHIPYYQERHLVRPGIAGWAQVNYPYGASPDDAKQKLMYDLYYIKHWSLWLELKTILLTARAMLTKKGR